MPVNSRRSRSTSVNKDGNYSVKIADFGPIGHANVDLRPLTIFVGPSNTGKSYLAMLVYALHQCFGPPNSPRARQRHRSFWFSGPAVDLLPDEDDLSQRVVDWLSTGSRNELAPLPPDLAGVLLQALEQIPGADAYVAREVSRCFGVDVLGDLVRRGSRDDGAQITLNIPTKNDRDKTRYRLDFGLDGVQVGGRIMSLPSLSREDFGDDLYYSSMPDRGGGHFLLSEVLDAMFQALIRPVARPAYYLPADRTGVMHSHQVVVSTLIQSATTAGLRPSTNVPMLSGVLADFLDDLIGMSRLRRRSSRALSETMEKNLLAGAIRLQHSDTGYPSFSYRPVNWDTDLPLMRTSSMVSELAPVVLYLRYFVRPGNLLIIEEPESHLHPALQTTFVRELARLVRSGVRIMLTTHSEWMLETLANLVRLSQLSETERTQMPEADVSLEPHHVGAWLFRPSTNGSGSAVEEILLDTEAGNYPAGFGVVTESLYNEWVGISNRIDAAQADDGG